MSSSRKSNALFDLSHIESYIYAMRRWGTALSPDKSVDGGSLEMTDADSAQTCERLRKFDPRSRRL